MFISQNFLTLKFNFSQVSTFLKVFGINNTKNSADLANMYTLVKPLSSGLAVLVKEFENYVKRIALECVQNLKGDNVAKFFCKNFQKN